LILRKRSDVIPYLDTLYDIFNGFIQMPSIFLFISCEINKIKRIKT